MKIILLFIIIICIINFINAIKLLPAKQILNGLVLDQHHKINSNFFPNVNGSIVKGILNQRLNETTRVPELKSLLYDNENNQNANIVRPDLFKFFFENNKLFNVPIKFDITLNYNKTRGLYTYSNAKLYPIDGVGYDLYNANTQNIISIVDNKTHNYEFTYKINYMFEYKGLIDEMINITSDNDVWVYIDNNLVIDLGNSRVNNSEIIEINKLNLTVGNSYSIDIFYSQRNLPFSTFIIETNLQFFCPAYDRCGVCQGDDSTCKLKCNKFLNGQWTAKNSTDCGIELEGSADICTAYYCNEVNGCYSKPICQNPFNNKCKIAKCSVRTDESDSSKLIPICEHILRPDIDDNNDCTIDDCDPKTGIVTHQLSKKCSDCKNEKCN